MMTVGVPCWQVDKVQRLCRDCNYVCVHTLLTRARPLLGLSFMTWTAVLGVNKDTLLLLGSHKAMADVTQSSLIKLRQRGFICMCVHVHGSIRV